MDVHYKFSKVTFRDGQGEIVRRERLDHPDCQKLRERLFQWPKGLPVVLEASFGWGWLSDLMEEVGLEPHLSNCYKVEKMRQARGGVKTNDKDSDMTSRLPFEAENWWEAGRVAVPTSTIFCQAGGGPGFIKRIFPAHVHVNYNGDLNVIWGSGFYHWGWVIVPQGKKVAQPSSRQQVIAGGYLWTD